MFKLKDSSRVKHSLRGKKIRIIHNSDDNLLVELLEDAGKFKTGDQLLSFRSQIEQVEDEV